MGIQYVLPASALGLLRAGRFSASLREPLWLCELWLLGPSQSFVEGSIPSQKGRVDACAPREWVSHPLRVFISVVRSLNLACHADGCSDGHSECQKPGFKPAA